jgi:hypothetical protein
VLRVPHPSFLRWPKTHLFSDPVKTAIVDELEIPLLSFTDLEVMVRQEEGLDPVWWPRVCAPKMVPSA